MHLVFTGIQGCGKGTQARLLQKNYSFDIVEMGQELRNEIASGSELGLKLKEYMDSGILVPDELGKEIMKNAINKYKKNENVIFDAFIRLDWNKEVFDNNLSDYKVIFFNLPEFKAKQRLLGRMYNPKTGETFSAGTKIDPKTGEELIKRKDDNEKSILTRIEQYVSNTIPIIEKQKQEGKVIEVNADQAIEKVFEELTQKLGLKK